MRQRGFSLLEMLVSVALLALIMVGFLSMFDMSTRVSKLQSAVADTQDTLRYTMGFLVRWTRMTGTGGVPVVARDAADTAWIPTAVVVTNNVSSRMIQGPVAGVQIAVLDGTDILHIRGSFWSSVFHVVGYDVSTAQVVVAEHDLNGVPQDELLEPMRQVLNDGKYVPIMLVAAQTDRLELANGHFRNRQRFGFACLTSETSAGSRVFDFTTSPNETAGCPAAFFDLNDRGVYPMTMTNVVRMASVDDVTLYVALEPGTGVPTLYMLESVGPAQPIARDIIDLQVALGCDLDVNGVIAENLADGTNDEWVLNARGGTPETMALGGALPHVAYLTAMRVTLVARVPAPEMTWTQGPITNEDGRDILATDGAYLGADAIRYRYRTLTEQVKLRSLGAIQ